ncbi:ionotropic receptor 21a-like [Daphnia pulicaria]|uniref:ionotropic receptor 21a-like n=1 Tax=Daphnia pulicaria TaxID=35523 RepID=UPI001EEBF6C4|nr:ionotropic receptor 21a-like [Daphnia pulicaria]
MGPKRPGLISYLLRGESQVMLAFMGPSPERLRKVEVVHPWLYTPPAFLIPMPEILPNNVDAVIKPFQLWVWMGLVGAVASFIFTMSYLNRTLTSRHRSVSNNVEENVDQPPDVVTESVYMYVVGTLLNQGGSISCQITSVRLVVGAWCLMTLVLVNVYNGILISYVMAIHRAPPIASTELDIAFNPNIRLVVDKGQSGDLWFSTAQKGIFKGYGDKLRSYPNSRCNSSHQCVDLVKSLPPQHVYFSVGQ